jgi:hypothetical protein
MVWVALVIVGAAIVAALLAIDADLERARREWRE